MPTLDLYLLNEIHPITLWTWSEAADEKRKLRLRRRMSGCAYSAQLETPGSEPYVVVAKVADNFAKIKELDNENELYSHELRKLQGSVVPLCLGYYKGKGGNNNIACLILSYCSGLVPITENEEYNRKIMVLACKIHQAGVAHGDLIEGRHIVGTSIVDFSKAVRHKCRGAYPRGYENESPPGQCLELVQMEEAFGIFSGDRNVAKSLPPTPQMMRPLWWRCNSNDRPSLLDDHLRSYDLYL